MKKLNSVRLKQRIIDCFTFIPKVIRKLNLLSNHLLQLTQNLTPIHTHNNLEISNKILEKNKLDLMLDNIACPEEGRKLLYLLFKIKYSLPNNQDNIVIARHSLMNGYLSVIVKQLQLQIAPLGTNLNVYFKNLPKAPVIYSLDFSFSTLLFSDISYLNKLRAQCKDELIIAIKVNIEAQKENNIQLNNIYHLDKNEIYYTDHHIRRILHCMGFFEVLGPFTSFSDDYFTRSRMITPEGQYAILLNKAHPPFKGLSIYRAATKTFRQYSETSI